MLNDFFQLGPLPPNVMTGNYDLHFVLLSYIVAVFAGYIALDITGHLRETNNTKTSQLLWILGGSIAMGTGIWSMHFIGMLSFDIPGMAMHYELFWTLSSLLVAILISAFALSLLKIKTINIKRIVLGGVILGIGIASMHYTGMEAMDIDIHYLPGLFFISILMAIIASEAVLWLALKSNQVMYKIRVRLKFISAIIMGIAICSMDYMGMSAAVFTPIMGTMVTKIAVSPHIMALSIAAATTVILGIVFFVSMYKEALNHQQLEKSRQLGMAEVSSSTLHNVGNVLNSINVSSNLLIESIAKSKLNTLENLSTLLEENKYDLINFIANDNRGQQIPTLIRALADQHKHEQNSMLKESQILLTNLQHIKDIISMQQNLSKITDIEQIVSIAATINESLLMTDVNFSRHNIIIKKDLAEVDPILTDKVQLLQILVNVLRNAKDSLLTSTSQPKIISIKLTLINNYLNINITDNGAGISSQQMKKIFIHGYTTKQKGFGYGLHNSILSARSMGGDLKAQSDGLGTGATFILELPYRKPNI